MAAAVGREILLKKGATVLLGMRSVSLDWAGSSINITSGEDDGKRLLLAASGEEQIDLKFEGIAKDSLIRDLVLGGSSTMLTDVTLTWDDGATLACNFRLSGYSSSVPYNDAVTFSGSLESSGDWTYTPA